MIANRDPDSKVRSFLETHKGQWVDRDVPEVDGKVFMILLSGIIIKEPLRSARLPGARRFGLHGR